MANSLWSEKKSGQSQPLGIDSSLCIGGDTRRIAFDTAAGPWKLLKTTVQQGRSERKTEAYSEYVEALSEARTKLAVVFNSFLLVVLVLRV